VFVCVNMPRCFAPSCSNRSDNYKDAEKRCYEVSYRYKLLDEKTRKRKSGSVLSQFLAPVSLNKPSKILRLQ